MDITPSQTPETTTNNTHSSEQPRGRLQGRSVSRLQPQDFEGENSIMFDPTVDAVQRALFTD